MALTFSVTLLMSAGSGILHGWMARTQPPPPAAKPSVSVDPAAATLSPARASESLLDLPGEVRSVSVRPIGGEPWYQFIVAGQAVPQYVHARTGEAGSDREDERYASEIASAHLGGAEVHRTAFLTEYDAEYINIFRILPVYRFDADDGRGTRVYVSTMTGSVTRATDDRKQWEANLFSNLHKFMFITDRNWRDAALITATGGIFIAGLSGIFLFVMTLPRRR